MEQLSRAFICRTSLTHRTVLSAETVRYTPFWLLSRNAFSGLGEGTPPDTRFIEDGVCELLKTRRILKCSYPYGFFLQQGSTQKEIFELMQVIQRISVAFISRLQNQELKSSSSEPWRLQHWLVLTRLNYKTKVQRTEQTHEEAMHRSILIVRQEVSEGVILNTTNLISVSIHSFLFFPPTDGPRDGRGGPGAEGQSAVPEDTVPQDHQRRSSGAAEEAGIPGISGPWRRSQWFSRASTQKVWLHHFCFQHQVCCWETFFFIVVFVSVILVAHGTGSTSALPPPRYERIRRYTE